MKNWKQHIISLTLLGLFIVIAAFENWTYISSKHITMFGLLILPLMARKDGDSTSTRLLWPSLILSLITVYYPAKTLFFLNAGLLVLFFVETYWNKLNLLPLLGLFIISPFFEYFSKVFSFPVRLWISDMAANSLSLFQEAYAEGNIIFFKGLEYSVDYACMGLDLTTTTMLMATLFMTFQEINTKRSFQMPKILLVMSIFFGLNIVANYFRIIGLVLLDLPPENWLHDAFGMLTLIVYVGLPGYYIVKRFRPNEKSERKLESQPLLWKKLAVFVLMIGLVLGFKSREDVLSISETLSHPVPEEFQSFEKNLVKYDIWKLHSDSVLVYMKDLRTAFSSTHNPMRCWKGSGFELEKVKVEQIANHEVYIGLLKNGTDTIHSAWWYSNGDKITHQQLSWRFAMLQGEKNYYLININANSKEELFGLIQSWFESASKQEPKLAKH